LIDRLDASSIEVDGLSVRSPDLDDVFLSLTGRSDGRPNGREADRKVPTP
jgi:ABC-2 type transport system ATP-binding protein